MLEKYTKNEQDLLFPEQLFSIQEIQEVKQSIPDAPGAYAAYFKELPPFPKPLPKDLHVFCNKTLLYIGISEKDLRTRINAQHLGNSAHGSTTRLSIGVMFGYELRDHRKKNPDEEPFNDDRDKNKKGRIKGYTTKFTNTNEALLSDWLGSNVYFAYTEFEDELDICER